MQSSILLLMHATCSFLTTNASRGMLYRHNVMEVAYRLSAKKIIVARRRNWQKVEVM